MLTKLSIQNYALIEDISIDFCQGFTTISGETGAGKSILLGGLGLILGDRADSKALMNAQKKCVIEGEFNIENYDLTVFFEQNDIDYEVLTIIRRELLSSGKSRAFINDTPVRLNLLNELQSRLIDVHSQHQTLQLNDVQFQFQIIDSLANTKSLLSSFNRKHREYNLLSAEFELLKEKIKKEKEQYDYHFFLWDELEKANFQKGEQEKLEQEIERLNNIELIQQNLNESYNLLSDDEQGLVYKLHQIKQNIEKIKHFSNDYKNLADRLDSLHIELKDIEAELAVVAENDNFEKNEIADFNNRLELLFHLFQKHKVKTIEDLLQIQRKLSEKVAHVTQAASIIKEKEQQVAKSENELRAIGKKISLKRKKITRKLEKNLADILQDLGMPHAKFGITINQTKSFYHNGIDEIQFLFSANKGGNLASVKRVASGGELSRIMLAVKSIMATHSQLPTIIFDEIDSGVSGEIAIKMARIMQQMATQMQVVAITHLPQIVARGKQHMKVYKYTENQKTKTSIKLLNKKESVLEIAEMLGGKNYTDTAVNHAKQLLQ